MNLPTGPLTQVSRNLHRPRLLRAACVVARSSHRRFSLYIYSNSGGTLPVPAREGGGAGANQSLTTTMTGDAYPANSACRILMTLHSYRFPANRERLSPTVRRTMLSRGRAHANPHSRQGYHLFENDPLNVRWPLFSLPHLDYKWADSDECTLFCCTPLCFHGIPRSSRSGTGESWPIPFCPLGVCITVLLLRANPLAWIADLGERFRFYGYVNRFT